MASDEAIDAAVARALERTPPLPEAIKNRISSALQSQTNQRPGSLRQEERRTAGLENL